MTHTPGPWEIKFASGAFIIAQGSTNSSNSIAQVVMFDDSDTANARLIAAAPQLLSLLEEIRKWMDAEIMGAWDAKFIAEIGAAIAQAKGEKE